MKIIDEVKEELRQTDREIFKRAIKASLKAIEKQQFRLDDLVITKHLKNQLFIKRVIYEKSI